MNYRHTKYYKSLNKYDAVANVEGFDGLQHTKDEILSAWQYLVDKGLVWSLQGWYGRTATSLIERGFIQK